MANRSYSTSRKRKTQEGGENKPFPMVKIDNKNLAELVDKIVNYISDLSDVKDPISVVARHIPNSEMFNALNDVDTTSDVISIEPGKKVGVRKFGAILHVIYCPDVYPIYSEDDDIIPKSILDTTAKTTGAPREIVRYIFRVLHELGHIYGSVDHLGYCASVYLAVDAIMDAYRDYEYERYKEHSTREEKDASYRNMYSELFADHFAYKWLAPVLTNIDVQEYFAPITQDEVKKLDKEEG